jgi:hypothetical protein
MDNPLKIWFYSTGKIVSDTSLATHYSMEGFKLDLSEDYDTFQELYAKNIKFKNCLVEKKTDFFRLFIDFDVLSESIVDEEPYLKCIQDVINNIYNIKNLKCISTAPDKNIEIIKEDKTFIKQGFHFHWPELIVDVETAIKIRSNILVNIKTIFGKVEHFDNDWEKIIDKCVYKKNGLRLIGSDKCTVADNTRVYEDRVYILKNVYIDKNSNRELVDYYTNNMLALVKDTSVRSSATEITKYVNLNEYEEEERQVSNSELISISKKSLEYSEIEKFFKNHATGYNVEDLGNISRVRGKDMYLIYTKSKYCQNKQGFHRNNHIYFKLTPAGLCQKCLSQNTGLHGCCRDYQSSYVPLSTGIISALKWKKPKSKDIAFQEPFSLNSLLERLENRVVAKDAFRGPGKRKNIQ